MELSFRDEEGKSRMHAAEENNPSPVDAAGSELAGGKRKMTDTPLTGSSLKRICAPSDEPLLVPSDDLHHPPTQIQKSGQQINQDIKGDVVPDDSDIDTDCDNGSDIDIDPDYRNNTQSIIKMYSDTFSESDSYSDAEDAEDADLRRMWRIRRSKKTTIQVRVPTAEELFKYLKEIQDSQGFDVSFCYRFHTFASCYVTEATTELLFRKYDHYKHLMDLAAKFLGKKEQLKDLMLVKLNYLLLGRGSSEHTYITFIGTGSSDDVVRCYQAKVTSIYQPNHHDLCKTVHFVWLKDECGHLAVEDIRKQQQCSDMDSLRQLYMDEFCPIRLLNQDRTRVLLRARFKHFVILAADKASKDLNLGEQKLKDLELVEAYEQLLDLTAHYYITFKGSLDGECRFYGAKVIASHNYETMERLNYKVESVWSNDDPIHPTVEERVKNRKVKEARKCFDVDTRSTDIDIQGVITPIDPETIKGEMEAIIIGGAKNCGLQEKLEDLQIEKANMQCFGHTKHHYITFTANGECRRRYRAKVTLGGCYFNDESKLRPPECEFVWLEDPLTR